MHKFAATTAMDVLHQDVTNLHAKTILSWSEMAPPQDKNSSAIHAEEMEVVYYSDQIYIFSIIL